MGQPTPYCNSRINSDTNRNMTRAGFLLKTYFIKVEQFKSEYGNVQQQGTATAWLFLQLHRAFPWKRSSLLVWHIQRLTTEPAKAQTYKAPREITGSSLDRVLNNTGVKAALRDWLTPGTLSHALYLPAKIPLKDPSSAWVGTMATGLSSLLRVYWRLSERLWLETEDCWATASWKSPNKIHSHSLKIKLGKKKYCYNSRTS